MTATAIYKRVSIRHLREVIHQLQEDRVPVLITEHGRSAAALLGRWLKRAAV